MGDRLAAISVDLDEVPCYAAIHGLAPPLPEASHAVYRRALPRLAALFAGEGIPATFFVIGRDLRSAGNAAALKSLAAQGHELGNHSQNHLYDLTRQDPDTVRQEIAACSDALEAAVGVRPTGFRAPGYTVTDVLLDTLSTLHFTYDSSVFPCPSYYAAKAVALASIALRGRSSSSILDDLRVLTAPADPYRVGTPYWRRGAGLVELPIGVSRGVTGRLPFIGTSVILSGTRGARALTSTVVGRPLVNLELHGIDLADADEDGLAFLRPHQPDLRVSLADKEAALRAAIGRLREGGYRFVTLAEAASRLRR